MFSYILPTCIIYGLQVKGSAVVSRMTKLGRKEAEIKMYELRMNMQQISGKRTTIHNSVSPTSSKIPAQYTRLCTTYQPTFLPTLSTHPLNPPSYLPSQHTLSIHPPNTPPYQPPYQPTLLIHPLNHPISLPINPPS